MAYENDPHRRRETDHTLFKTVSWGAIFAGFVMAFVINLALNLLGIGIGIGTVDPMQQDAVPQGLGTGAIIWFVTSIIISLIIGGWVAARLSGIPNRMTGILHGLLAWCLFTIFTFYLLTTAIGSAIGVTGKVVGQAFELAGQGVSAVAPEAKKVVQQQAEQSGIDIQNIQEEAAQLAQEAAKNPEQLNSTITEIFGQGDDTISEADRQKLADAITEYSDMNETEARQVADRWSDRYEQASQEVSQFKEETEQKARVAAEDVGSAASTAAIAGFFGLLLGALASAAGGAMGRPEDTSETVRT